MTTSTTHENATTTSTHETNGVEKTPRKVVKIVEYATKEECEANRPEGADAKNSKDEYVWKPYKVTRPNATVTWIWAVGSVNAASTIARIDGYVVSLGEGRQRAAQHTDAFAGLAKLDDATLATLGLSAETLAKVKAIKGTTLAENVQDSKRVQEQHTAGLAGGGRKKGK